MALVPCEECGKEISTNAKTCPGCGSPSPEELRKAEKKAQLNADADRLNRRIWNWYLNIVGIFFAIALFIYLVESNGG